LHPVQEIMPPFDLHSYIPVALRLILAFIVGGVIGFERELRGSTAGDRTFSLVGGAAAAITAVTLRASPQAVAGATALPNGTALIREVAARTAVVLAPASPERVEQLSAVAALEKAVSASGGGNAGRNAVADKVAYTWFNRLAALRYMELHGYLDHGYRVRPETKTLPKPPSAYLKQIFYDTITHDDALLAYLVGRVGPQHVVVGTDRPFDMGIDDPRQTVTRIPGLDDAARSAILGGNARSFLSRAKQLAEVAP